jgi:hypothetical protein
MAKETLKEGLTVVGEGKNAMFVLVTPVFPTPVLSGTQKTFLIATANEKPELVIDGQQVRATFSAYYKNVNYKAA